MNENWWNKFSKDEIFFVSPDVKRGIGLVEVLPNYHLICTYDDPVIAILRKNGAKIFCLEEKIYDEAYRFNNSGKLLEHPQVVSYIRSQAKSRPQIMFFKPSLKLETVIRDLGFGRIGNSYSLNEEFENKFKFFELVKQNFPAYSIPGEIGGIDKLTFSGLVKKYSVPFIIQFARGWAGKTTYLIKEEKDFNRLKEQYTHMVVKVNKFIRGYTVLNNACIYEDKVLISSEAYQISGVEKLCKKETVTCGRQWPAKKLSKNQKNKIHEITRRVGELMKNCGYRGYFGLDFQINEATEKVYLSENNARLTASTQFWTRLEIDQSVVPLLGYHLATFLGRRISPNYITDISICGSQLILRNRFRLPDILQKNDFGVFGITKDQKPVLHNKKYYPEKLHRDEFIYMKKFHEEGQIYDSEFGRIESKMEVLERPAVLKQWVKDLLL